MNEAKANVKNIVVFGANGGIGKETAHALADQMTQHPEDELNVFLITRKEGDRPNIGQGVTNEIRVAYVNSPAKVMQAFKHENHLLWDEQDPESLRDVLSKANAIIVAAGVPRKRKPDGTMPTRSELLEKNAAAATNIGTLIGQYAPVETPVINCVNPADVTGGLMERVCLKAWDKRGVPAGERPQHKVLTMGSTLDESRLRVFLAEGINAYLAQAGKPEIIPYNIEAVICGQHGNGMVFDRDSIFITDAGQRKSLKDYLRDNDLAEHEEAIWKTAMQKTISGGGDLESLLGNTAQLSPAIRMAEIAMAALFSDKPYTLSGAVTHSWGENDPYPVASGARVDVSKAGIHINQNWLEYARKNADLSKDIAKSRLEIAQDQASYDLVPLLQEHGDSITRSKEASGGDIITIQLRDVSLDEVKRTTALLEKAQKVAPGTVKSIPGTPPSVRFPASSLFDALAKTANISIREGMTRAA